MQNFTTKDGRNVASTGCFRSSEKPVMLTDVDQLKYADIAKFAGHLPHRYGNSRAIWDHTEQR